jgi:hypothetical protein
MVPQGHANPQKTLPSSVFVMNTPVNSQGRINPKAQNTGQTWHITKGMGNGQPKSPPATCTPKPLSAHQNPPTVIIGPKGNSNATLVMSGIFSRFI